MSVYFPRKSHHGYFDEGLQRKFHDKKEKRAFLKEHGFHEDGPASKAHMKRVVEFNRWTEHEKKKNPNFEQSKQFKQAKYPD